MLIGGKKKSRGKKNRRNTSEKLLRPDCIKAPILPMSDFKVYFVEWKSSGKRFINGVKFVAPAAPSVRIHLFYNKKISPSELPMDSEWLTKHKSLTDLEDAPRTDLMAYMISFYTRATMSCHHCSLANPKPKFTLYLVCGEEKTDEELIAIMKANKVDVQVVQGWKKTLLDLYEHVCQPCKLIFGSEKEADLHDRRAHNFRCHNTQCEKSSRDNGFFAREELEEHLRSQRFCKYCPSDVFCTSWQFEQHIKQFHKTCPCPCKEYYEREDDFIEHFYSNYPLPCLEDPSCKMRFKNIEMQAFHHKSVHGSTYPYFCMACFKQERLVCSKTGEELLLHVEDKKHSKEDFEFAIIPDKIFKAYHEVVSSEDIKYPSSECAQLQYCNLNSISAERSRGRDDIVSELDSRASLASQIKMADKSTGNFTEITLKELILLRKRIEAINFHSKLTNADFTRSCRNW